MIEDCVKGLASLPQEIRRWLKSAKMEEVDPRPMGRLQNQDSQDRYANYWKRLICYSLRVAQSEQQQRAVDPSQLTNETDGGNEEEGESRAEDDDATDEEDEDDGDTSSLIVLQDKLKDARRLYQWRDGQKEQAIQLLKAVESGGGVPAFAILQACQWYAYPITDRTPFIPRKKTAVP